MTNHIKFNNLKLVVVIFILGLLVLALSDVSTATANTKAVTAVPFAGSNCATNSGFNLTSTDQNLLARLQNDIGTKATVSCHSTTGKVRFIGTDPAKPVPAVNGLSSSATPEEAARGFLTTYGSLFGLKNQSTELNVISDLSSVKNNTFI